MLNVCTHQLKEKEKEYTKEKICIKWTQLFFKIWYSWESKKS